MNHCETYAPVVIYSSPSFLFAMAAKYALEIHQMDAVTVFLQGGQGGQKNRYTGSNELAALEFSK